MKDTTPTPTPTEKPTPTHTPPGSSVNIQPHTPIERDKGTPSDDAKSPDEIKECLPEYEDPPANEDEQNERADELSTSLYNCLRGHPWYWSVGYSYDEKHNGWYLIVGVSDPEPAEQHIPDSWGDIVITIEQSGPPQPE